jgi:hypothetical protein
VTEGELIDDYCREGGLVVFTERYLRARGDRCRSGCRHRPYGLVREEPAQPQPA